MNFQEKRLTDSVSRSARGVYGISVTSDLSGVGPQTLRLYERRGLLAPSRTDGGTRRYSDDDLDRLRRITELVEQGVNLAGIAHILDLEPETASWNRTTPNWRSATPHSRPIKDQRQAAAARQNKDGRILVTADGDETSEPRLPERPTGRPLCDELVDAKSDSQRRRLHDLGTGITAKPLLPAP